MRLPSLLTVAFVVLKLTGFIDWSWWWVISPLPIGILVAFVLQIIKMSLEDK